jgi:phage FluMu protein Com
MSAEAAELLYQPCLIEKDVRCSNCDKLLTRVKFYITLPAGESYGDGSSISELFQGIEIKMGLETKCNRCKHMNHELNVI